MGSHEQPQFLNNRDQRFLNPHFAIQEDLQRIYEQNDFTLGVPEGRELSQEARPNTVAIVGISLGDEGKGRFVDNTIDTLLTIPGVDRVAVVRYQGGNNAGHTVERDGVKLALHVLPSSVLHEQAIGIMDRGMVIHPEDLKTEVDYVEENTGSLEGRIFLSDEAILVSDLERAEEFLNNQNNPQSKGGTRRGIAPAYAHNLDRTGLKIFDLLAEDWEEKLGKRYDDYAANFARYGFDLAKIGIPDFSKTLKTGEDQSRGVGSKKQFLKRLAVARDWMLQRDLIRNTFLLHRDIYTDPAYAVVFEGAQAAGLDAWLGTRPDTTASNTRTTGIEEGTALWKRANISDAIGVVKIPYTSSVGSRRLPTHIDLPKDLDDLPNNPTEDQQWAAYVRETAHEYGTTTGRPRDITFLDLGMITYNARMSGIDMLAATHLDVATEDREIKICTHYTDSQGNYIPYQPGLRHQEDVIPQYVSLPGWNGEQCRKAKSIEELPENAVKFLAFLQLRTGYPFVATTTGPKHSDYIEF